MFSHRLKCQSDTLWSHKHFKLTMLNTGIQSFPPTLHMWLPHPRRWQIHSLGDLGQLHKKEALGRRKPRRMWQVSVQHIKMGLPSVLVRRILKLLLKSVPPGCYETEPGFTRPNCSKTNLLTLGSGEGKYSLYCRVPSKENRQLLLKRPEPPMASGKCF